MRRPGSTGGQGAEPIHPTVDTNARDGQTAVASTQEAHHGRHKLGLWRAVGGGRGKHAPGALAHHRQAHAGAARGAPAFEEHGGGLWGGDAHPIKLRRPLRQHLRVRVCACGGEQ